MYYFHLSDANLITAYAAGIARCLPHTQTHALTLLTNAFMYTQILTTQKHTRAYRDAGRVIQLKKVKADVFPKNDGL